MGPYTLATTWAMPALTLVLVFITGWYARQTRAMVGEMRAGREEAARPRIVPLLAYDQVGKGQVFVANIGPGTALDVEVVLAFEPNGAPSRISLPVLNAGDQQPWSTSRRAYRRGIPNPYFDDAHLPNHTHIHLRGTCRDVLGRTHAIAARVPATEGWETLVRDTWQRAE